MKARSVAAYRMALRRQVSEKEVERLGRATMHLLGFSCWKFSQARATRQTPGIADMLFTRPGLAVWWEAKRYGGVQGEHQKRFDREVTVAGMNYLCGTDDDLADWCIARGLLERLPSGALRKL